MVARLLLTSGSSIEIEWLGSRAAGLFVRRRSARSRLVNHWQRTHSAFRDMDVCKKGKAAQGRRSYQMVDVPHRCMWGTRNRRLAGFSKSDESENKDVLCRHNPRRDIPPLAIVSAASPTFHTI